MATQRNLSNYQSLAQLLQLEKVALTPAEMHGLISGLLCGGAVSSQWLRHVYDLTNEGQPFSSVLQPEIEAMGQQIQRALRDDNFIFQPGLPEETDASVYQRADALSGWVNHFLLGLGVAHRGLNQLQGELKEALTDLRQIARLGYDEDEDQDALALALEEVVEYVRVVALMYYEHFSRAHRRVNAPRQDKPTLH